MKELYREYQNTDYQRCEELVNKAWFFDEIFKPESFSNLTKLVYTKGSIVNSNFKQVVEIDDEVVGFIFGLNENFKQPKNNILFNFYKLFKK